MTGLSAAVVSSTGTDHDEPIEVPRKPKPKASHATLMGSVRDIIADALRAGETTAKDSSIPERRCLAAPTLESFVPHGFRRLYQDADLVEMEEWTKTLPADSKMLVNQHLRKLKKLSPYRRVSAAPPPEALNELLNTFPNFREVTTLIQRRLVLCRIAPEQLCHLPPLLLAGPPGIGKTAYTKRIARALGAPYKEVDVATLTSPFALSGLDLGYHNGRPGLIWDLLQNECCSPVVLLDELDKSSDREDVLGFLYAVLEPTSATRYCDAAIRLPIDASHIIWMASCNQLEQVDAPIKSRFRVINVKAPDGAQLKAVVRSIHADMIATEAWAVTFDPILDDRVMNKLVGYAPRQIRQALEDAFATAATSGRRRLLASDVQPVSETHAVHRAIGFIDLQSTFEEGANGNG